MTVKELIAQLQKAPADAPVNFYDHKENKFLAIQHVEGGRQGTTTICVIGEVNMQTKCAVREALKAGQKPNKGQEDLTKLFSDMFGKH